MISLPLANIIVYGQIVNIVILIIKKRNLVRKGLLSHFILLLLLPRLDVSQKPNLSVHMELANADVGNVILTEYARIININHIAKSAILVLMEA